MDAREARVAAVSPNCALDHHLHRVAQRASVEVDIEDGFYAILGRGGP